MFPIIERARRYVQKCDPAVSGQGGHNRTFHVACLLAHGFDLPDSDALIVFREWNAGCSPPWSESQLIHKIATARTASHQLPRGHLLDARERRQFSPTVPSVAPTPKRPVPVDPLTATERFLSGFRCSEQDLAEASPVRVDGEWKYDGAVLVGALYQPGERINFVTDFETTQERDGAVKAASANQPSANP